MTPAERGAFLAELRAGGTVASALAAAGVSRYQLWRERARLPHFDRAVRRITGRVAR